MRVRRRGLPGLLSGLAVAGLVAGSLLAAPAAGALARPAVAHRGSGLIGSGPRPVNARAVLAYWTRARLRAATPVDVINAGARPPARSQAARPTGKPGRSTGGRPDGRAAFPVAPAAHGTSALVNGYPYPFSSFNVATANYTQYPYSMNGRLFFTNNGAGHSCSATVVGSHNGTGDENEVWTAGHCLVNTDANNQVIDSPGVIFIPAYNGNSSNFDPFGEFVWDGGWETTTAWYYNRDLTEDEAAMTFGNSSLDGATLGNNVGWDGFAWNWSVNENFTAFGYPADSPYNGASMVEDIASTGGQDGAGGANPVNPIVIGNPMTGGSSGGAWNVDWTPSSSGFIDGHNDYKYGNQPLAMYSPYQDTLSNQVRCFGASSC